MRDPEIIEAELMEISAAGRLLHFDGVVAWCAAHDEVPFAPYQLLGRPNCLRAPAARFTGARARRSFHLGPGGNVCLEIGAAAPHTKHLRAWRQIVETPAVCLLDSNGSISH
jgi:hypothetical protein